MGDDNLIAASAEEGRCYGLHPRLRSCEEDDNEEHTSDHDSEEVLPADDGDEPGHDS
jgi:hypothetical protein